MDTSTSELETLRQEVCYLRKLSEESIARKLSTDLQAVAIRHELEQKRRGFKLMAELASLDQNTDYETLFVSISRRINAALNMQRTAVLIPDAGEGFRPVVVQGYSTEEQNTIMAQRIELPEVLLNATAPILVTAADPDDYLSDLRKALNLPYLILSPVLLHCDVVAVVITGRIVEEFPFLPRLSQGDADTVQTVSGYLAAVLTGHRLRQAESLANCDPLTLLPNLRGTTEHLRGILALAKRENASAAVMFVDLDGFKSINDNLGHAAGDIVLRIVADRLAHCVRESDLVGRIGGDEFIVALSRISNREITAMVARKIIDRLNEPIDIDGTSAKVGASIGISIFPEHGTDETRLLHSADEAMYMAKNAGKNDFRYAKR